MGFENTLARIPGLGGYLAQNQINDQQGMNELTRASGAMGVLSKLQAQQEAMQMKEVLTTSKSLEDATAKLMRLGSPAAIKTAQELMQMQDAQSKMARTRRENAFRDPRNLAQFMTPGKPGIQPDPQEFEQAADRGMPPPVASPGQPGRIDPKRLLEGALAAGVIDPLAYAKEQITENKPQFAPRDSPGYFQGGKFIQTPVTKEPSDPLSKAIAGRDALAAQNPNHPLLPKFNDYINKLSTHQPPVNVYSGSLTAGVDEYGRPIFIQPSGRGNVPPRKVAGVYPPERADQRKASEKESQARRGFEAANKQINDLIARVDEDPTVVGAAGMVNRVIEGVRGQIPGQESRPSATDFASGLALLQSTVYRDLVGSGQISAGDYKHIGEIIRGKGVLDSPQATKNALEEVRKFLSAKVPPKKQNGVGKPKAEDFFRK